MSVTVRDVLAVAKPVRYPVRVTNRPCDPRRDPRRDPRVRRAARVLALAPALLVTTTAGAAMASPPESWKSPPSTSTLYVLVVLVAIPVALFVLITLLVYLPSMTRGGRSDEGWRGEAEWFGGPRGGLEAVDKAEQPRALSGGTGPDRGGDSGRW